MFGQTWIESLNMVFGTDTTGSAVMMGFLLLISLTVVIVVAASANRRLFEIVTISDFLTTLLLVYWEWFPQFTGLMIAFIFAMLGAWIITGGGNNA